MELGSSARLVLQKTELQIWTNFRSDLHLVTSFGPVSARLDAIIQFRNDYEKKQILSGAFQIWIGVTVKVVRSSSYLFCGSRAENIVSKLRFLNEVSKILTTRIRQTKLLHRKKTKFQAGIEIAITSFSKCKSTGQQVRFSGCWVFSSNLFCWCCWHANFHITSGFSDSNKNVSGLGQFPQL